MLIKNRKGDVTDVLIVIVTIFILAIGFFIIAFLIPTISDNLAGAGLNSSTEGADALDTLNRFGTINIQRGFLFVQVFLLIGIIVTAFLIRTNAVFTFLYILFLVIAIALSVYFTNAYELLISNPIFAETAQSQTLINLVMLNLTRITLVTGALSLIITFSKGFSGGGEERI